MQLLWTKVRNTYLSRCWKGFRSIEPQCSKRHNIIQMVDVVIGAIAAKRNDRKNVAHKAELADYVLEKSGHGDWSRDTVKNARYFTVWNFKHQ